MNLTGVARVNLETTEVEPFVVLDNGNPRSLATDGTHLFVSSTRTSPERTVVMEAYRLQDGELAWTWEPPELYDSMDERSYECIMPAVAGAVLYHACSHGLEGLLPEFESRSYLVALDKHTGEEKWIWTTQEMIEEDPEGRPTRILGATVIDDRLFAPALSGAGAPVGLVACPDPMIPCDLGSESPVQGWIYNVTLRLLAFGTDGGFQWSKQMGGLDVDMSAAGTPVEHSDFGDFIGVSVRPTGTSNKVYVKMVERVHALNPGRGNTLWSERIAQEDVTPERDFSDSSFALSEDALYTTSAETLYRFEPETGVNRWRMALDPAHDERFHSGDLILAGDTLYVGALWREGNGTTLYAVDTRTGDVRWRLLMPVDQEVREAMGGWNPPHYQSVSDGLVVIAGGDGSLRVIGTTNASLRPVVESGPAYPGVGDPVSVDLSGSGPGVHGNATRFKAEWGDGTVSDWQDDPVLTHTYNETGDIEARFIVGNDANQTASTFVTFNVGQEPPAELNFLQNMFARENQNMTFGILGVLVALSGGVIGVTHRHRKRSRLQNELKILEEGYKETRGTPGECEAFLETRKARARSLMLDGDLEEDQFHVIEKRVEEMNRELRTSVLDDRFDFLPHGMVESVKKALVDGHLNSWERKALDALVEQEEGLTDGQKERVRGQLDKWVVGEKGGEKA